MKKMISKFTLIELLIIIAIIGILTAMLLPALGRAKYQAMNASCISNLKNMATGTINYATENNGFFPNSPSSTTLDIYPPTMIFMSGEFDWRPGLSPYFSGSLKSWVCPLSDQRYFKNGGVKWSRTPVDIDTETGVVMTSYAHFFGRTNGTGDSYWGSGAATFTSLTKEMTKLGTYLQFDFVGTQHDDKEFTMLSSDMVQMLWKKKWYHGTYGAKPAAEGTNTYYGEFWGLDVRTYEDVPTDMNYSTQDGSVQTLRRIKFPDARVITTFHPEERGWVIPLEAEH